MTKKGLLSHSLVKFSKSDFYLSFYFQKNLCFLKILLLTQLNEKSLVNITNLYLEPKDKKYCLKKL